MRNGCAQLLQRFREVESKLNHTHDVLDRSFKRIDARNTLVRDAGCLSERGTRHWGR